MKKLTDEEIQKMLESKSHVPVQGLFGMDEDARMHELVFEELKKEPVFTLPDDFSARTTEKIWKAQSKYYFEDASILLIISILSAVAISLAAIAFINMPVLRELFMLIVTLKWIILFGVGIFGSIEIVDKFIIRRRLGMES